MGIIADKLRNGTTSIEQMNQDIAAREAEEQAVQDSVASQDSSMWEDVKGFFGDVGSAIANHYNVTTYNAIKNSISDEEGNITPTSIAQYENPVQSTYSGVFGQQSYEDHYNDSSYNMNNYPESFQSHVRDSLNSWGNTVSDDIYAVYNSGGADGKWKLYEDAVAKPAMMAAATPFVPAPARIAAGILGAPDMISSAINAGSDGYNDKDGDGSGGILGAIGGIGNALIAQPLQQLGQAVMHPIDTAEDIYQHPENLWHNVLEPGMIAEMGVRGGKAGYGAIRDYADQRAIDGVIDRNIETAYPMESRPTTYGDVHSEPVASSFRTGIDDSVDSYVVSAAAKYDVDPSLLAKVIDQESTYGRNPDAGGNLAQISDDLAREYGLDKTDPAQSIEGGARYLKSLIDDNGGDVREALAAYNGGPGNKQYGYADQVLGREIGGEMGETRSTATGGAMDAGEQAWLGQEMPHGGEGCVEAVVRVGSYHDGWLAEEARKGETYVPNLVRDAGDRVVDFDPAKLEKGDVIVYGDNDHVVLYDGKGGYVGNSTSLKQVVHGADYREMGGLQPTKIIKTAERPDSGRTSTDNVPNEYDFGAGLIHRNEEIARENDANVDVLGNKVGVSDNGSQYDFGGAGLIHNGAETFKTDAAMKADVDAIINRDAPAKMYDEPETTQGNTAKGDYDFSGAGLIHKGAEVFKDEGIKVEKTIDDVMKEDVDKLLTDEELIGGDVHTGTDFSVRKGGKAPRTAPMSKTEIADLPEYRPGRELETVSKQDILQRAEELFAPVYDGYTGRMVDGFTRTKTGELRTGRWGDLDTMAHELGHIIDNNLSNGSKVVLKEFRDNVERNHGKGAYETKYIAREGRADFIKDYFNDEATAKSNFPRYYDMFKDNLEKNPDMAQRVSDMQDLYKRYNEQSPQARWGSSITYGEQPSNKTWKEKASDVMNTIDKKVYDDLTELKGIDKIRAALKGVKELATESSIYKMARLSRGQASAYTEMLIKGKDPVGTISALNKAFGDRGVFKHDVTLQSAMDIVKDAVKTDEGKAFLQKGNYKDAMQAMDALLSARRFSELQKIDLEKMRELSTLMRNLSDQTKSASIAEGKPRELSSNHLQEMYEAIEAKYGKDYAVLVDDAINHVLNGKKHVREDVPGNVLVDASKVFDKYIENLDDLKKHYVHEYDAPGKIADAQSVIDAAPKEFHAAAEEIYKLQDNVMRAYKDAGLISEAQYTAMQKYKNYVPLATDFGVSKGASKMFGNDSMFVNLGDEIKSQVAKDSREKVLPIKSPLATIVGNTHDMLGKAVRNKIGQLLVEDISEKNGARLATEVKGAADPNKKTFNVWIDGEKHTYQTTPEIYKILETCGDVKTGTFAIKVLRAGATLTRTTNVLGPAFQAANGLRDAYFAAFRTTGGWLGLMNPMQPGYGRAVYHLIKDAIGKDSVMEEYRATGAKMSTLAAYGHEPIQMEIMRLAGEQSKKRKVWDTFNDRVLRFGESMEALPRLREYMRVRAKGGSFEDAAYAARNITIDFSRAGEWGRDWNQIDAFFNAALQGTKVLYETAKNDPKRFGKDLAAGVVIPTVAYWAYTRNQDWYADRPDWEKNSYWLFKSDTLASIMGFKDGIVKLPKSQEVGILFGSGMEAMLDATIGGKKAKDIFPGWAKAEADTILPNLFSNAVTTPFELMANYSIFTGRNIIPDKFKNMPADKQVTEKTTGFAKAMADDINKIFGTKISPMEVDFAGKGVLGNIYKIPTTGSLGFDRFEGKGTSSKALDAYYQRKEELTEKYNGISADSYETGRLKNAKAQKSVNLNKMDATDAYNYRRMQEADKLMQQVNDKVRKGKMSQEDAQRAKINIARAVKWR